LIIEDEENLFGLLRGYLEREGFEVHEASDGKAGAASSVMPGPVGAWPKAC
jgi:DNA-binding response OmpR family regulator